MNKNIDQLLLSFSNKKSHFDSHSDEDPKRIGFSVPKLKSILKKEFLFTDEDTSIKKLSYWDDVWKNSVYFESMSLALYFYHGRQLSKNEFIKIKSWINRCSCWEHSDNLSKIYAQIVEDNPTWILPTLEEWNRSSNLWKKRQSVVSLIEYSRKRKTVLPFKKLIQFIEPLLGDEEYYVQKGLGWTMREIYNIYPDKMLKFFDKNLTKISPLAYSAATEKLDKKCKQKFNTKRKNSRASQKLKE